MENNNNNNNHNKTKMLVVLGLALVLGVLFTTAYVIRSSSRATTDDAYIEGRIHSISAKISGTVTKVYVNDNQGVKRSDLLLEIDPEDYQLKVNEAQAALDAQKSKLIDAEAGIKTAAANLQIQEITFNQARLDLQRAEALFKDGVITREKHEKATTAWNLAEAQVKAAQEMLEKARSVKALEESVVKQKEASLQIAQRNLSYTKVFASSDGYITGKSVEAGNQVQAGQPLMAVVALDDIWLVANYKETQLKNVKPGQSVEIKVDTYPGKKFTGRVESIMAGTGAVFSLFPPENALGNYVKVVQRVPVKIAFDQGSDSRHILRIGMSCVPTILTKDE
jgi:membrane fusion protein, multidrug efflux system